MVKSTTRTDIAIVITTLFFFIGGANAQRQMENLGRGVVAINKGNGKVYVGWRMLGTDPDDIAFNLYRSTGGEEPIKLNDHPLTESTNFVDSGANLSQSNSYFVKPVVNGKEQEASDPFTLQANAPAKPYISIPLQTPDGYRPNDAAVGDLDGDGEYDIVLKQEMRGRDNSRRGVCPGTTKLEGYKIDGTFLWRIDLGRNIREGAHYTPFIVYDLDGDGIAEIAVRTSEETIDGTGTMIGDTDGDDRTNYVNPETGYILEGPEFISIYDGRTGKEVARDNYIARGKVTDWGDDYGNRVDRFLMGVAYLDGERPSLIICRGYYELTKLEAWNYRDGKLTKVWHFTSDDWPGYARQGNHNLSIGDVDSDGRDEIVYGACCIDDDGTGLYTTGLGHGDAMHLSDMDPDRPGLEVFQCHEPVHDAGIELRDAGTGQILWAKPTPKGRREGPGRAMSMDIDPRYRGYECWAAGGINELYSCKGEVISDTKPRSCNMGIWWDGDVTREFLDGTRISKWDYENSSANVLLSAEDFGCVKNNGSKSNPCINADILGDWREEVIWRTEDNSELRIFTTTISTDQRFYTFMHDPIYRISVALQNVGYNQPTQPGFYMGDGMETPPRPYQYNKEE